MEKGTVTWVQVILPIEGSVAHPVQRVCRPLLARAVAAVYRRHPSLVHKAA